MSDLSIYSYIDFRINFQRTISVDIDIFKLTRHLIEAWIFFGLCHHNLRWMTGWKDIDLNERRNQMKIAETSSNVTSHVRR